MKKVIILSLVLFLTAPVLYAQKYTAERAFISFFSDAVMEDITAENKKVSTIFNASSGEIAFSVPMKEFQFAKSLMQEHFNEKYVESEKFPKATFAGKITGFNPKTPGVQNVNATGKLTIHGVTKDIDVPGTIETQGTKLLMKSKFMIKVADYNITIPQLVFQNIAEQVEVTLDFTYKPL